MNKTTISIHPATDSDRGQWDSRAKHPLQTWVWGEFRTSMGIDVVRLVIKQNKKIIDSWQITFHKIPYTSWMIGYFPKGPMPNSAMLEKLAELARQKNAIFIQLEPNAMCHCEESASRRTTWQSLAHASPHSREIASLIARNDKLLMPSHHPLFTKYTFILDLTKSEEELLKAMHPKSRYNIRIAQKHGVTIAEDSSPTTFDQYIQLVQETTHRQRFYAHNETYHRRMWQTMHAAGIAKLFTATYQKTILAAWIIFVWNKTIYYPYGASSREHREVMAPTLLLWEVARWGKRQRYQAFDLWGSLGPNPDEHDPWFGFHRFKQGFNPDLVEFIGSYDLVLHPLLYRIYQATDTVRWKILK